MGAGKGTSHPTPVIAGIKYASENLLANIVCL